MLRPLVKRPFTAIAPSKQMSTRTFTSKTQRLVSKSSITTISPRAFVTSKHITSPFRISTRAFKTYPLYPQLPISTNVALAYYSFPTSNFPLKSISKHGSEKDPHYDPRFDVSAAGYYNFLPLSLTHSYKDLVCEARNILRESCGINWSTGDKETEVRLSKIDISIVWQDIGIKEPGDHRPEDLVMEGWLKRLKALQNGKKSAKELGMRHSTSDFLLAGPTWEKGIHVKLEEMDEERLSKVLGLVEKRGWKDVFHVRVGDRGGGGGTGNGKSREGGIEED